MYYTLPYKLNENLIKPGVELEIKLTQITKTYIVVSVDYHASYITINVINSIGKQLSIVTRDLSYDIIHKVRMLIFLIPDMTHNPILYSNNYLPSDLICIDAIKVNYEDISLPGDHFDKFKYRII